jgi:uncharacterized glyoxalase superfamily protein PhnB/uncharacterized protein YndB with AHSA1/START domain
VSTPRSESAARSVSSEVTVAISRQEAFTAFTDEMDLWWVRGPINFYDSARAVARVCEQGVGGRILEVYGADPGDALELARITDWQPPERLAWRSLVDDVQVEVTFAAAVSGGTTVRVIATVPAGGQDRGGTSFQRVVPDWFGAWCARRDTAPREPDELDRLALAVYYARPVAAARWLAHAFGFAPTRRLPAPEQGQDPDAPGAGPVWLEFRVGQCSLIVFRADGESGDAGRARGDGEAGGAGAGGAGAREAGRARPTHVPWIYVDDLEAHLARAQAAGASIVEPIRQHGYRAYQAEDLEGHRWTFAQARPTMR